MDWFSALHSHCNTFCLYMLLSKCETLYRTKEVIVWGRAVWDGSGPHRVCILYACVCVCVGCNKFLSSLCRHERLGRQPEQKPFKQKPDDVRRRPSQHRTDQPGRRILATPTLGPPFFPWCPRPRGQHLQRAAVGVGRTSHHRGGRRSDVRKRRVKAYKPDSFTCFFRSSTPNMASSGSAGQSGFRLGRAKKNPGVMDQIGKIFGGDKKRKSKVRRSRICNLTKTLTLHFFWLVFLTMMECWSSVSCWSDNF